MIMNQSYTVLTFVLVVAATKVDAFLPSINTRHHCNPSPLQAAEGTDFDAPVLYAPESASGPLHHEIVVDDECYMGKDGNAGVCVDFDPPKIPINLKSLLQQMETDFDAPVPYNPQSASPLANTPIVDDECYMGKDGNAGVCVDFDPPVVPISLRRILEEIDFDAPVPYSPASAKPLANTPIVDDECYLGKDGKLDECADFDPVTSGVSTYEILSSQEDA